MAQIQQWTKPSAGNVVFETLTDVFRPKPELVLENALLRQQVIVLRRKVKHPQLTNTDRRVLVVLTSRKRAWRRALLVVKPETSLQWHRDLFKLVWRHKLRARVGRPG